MDGASGGWYDAPPLGCTSSPSTRRPSALTLNLTLTPRYDALPLGKHSLAKHAPSVEARDAAKQKRLWELSERLVA